MSRNAEPACIEAVNQRAACAPAIPLRVLIDASEALKMVKDLPVGATLHKGQWEQVMRASHYLENHINSVLRYMPPVAVEGVGP